MSEALLAFHQARLDVAGSVATEGLSFTTTGSRLALMGDWSAWFRLLLGAARLQAGTASILGLSVSEALARGRVAVISPKSPLPGSFSVRRLFCESARLAGFPQADAEARALQVATELNLSTLNERRIEALSRVELRAVWVAHAIITWPEVIFIEDLLTGLAEHEKDYLWRLTLGALAGRKWGIVLPSDDPSSIDGAVFSHTDEVLVLDHGHLAYQGAARQQAASAPQVFRVVVARNSQALFAKLSGAGLKFRPIGHISRQEPVVPGGGTAGRAVVELPSQDAVRTLLALSLSENAPIFELIPLYQGQSYLRAQSP